MQIIFEGYHRNIPLYVYFILFCLTTALAWWTYKDLQSRSSIYKYVLISLRSIVFLILFLVLLNPVFNRKEDSKIKPRIAVLLDNSQSMTINKGNYHGRKTYANTIDGLELSDTSYVHYDLYEFAQNVRRIRNIDSLSFNGNETNLNHIFQVIEQEDRPYKGVVLVTDGIFTFGRDPSYAASHFNIPVFTVGVGDTTHLKDIVLQQIQVNDKAYLNTITPLNVTILNDGFPNRTIMVNLKHNGEIIDHKSIHLEGSKSSGTVQFKIKPEETGIQQYEVIIPKLQGEWTDSNNHKNVNINVLNDKIKILDLAFEIHPDVKTVRSILEADKSIRLYERTWISGDRFLGGDLPSKADSLDLIILHGFPNNKMSSAVISKVYDLCNNKPVLLITTPLTNMNRLSDLFKGQLPLVFQKKSRFYDVVPRLNKKESDQSILDLPSVNLSAIPDVRAYLGNAKPAIGAKVLYLANFHNGKTSTPLLAIRTIGNKRISEINFFNFYKWYQDPDGNVRQFTVSLINNIVKWTSTSPDNRLLKIEPVKKAFDESENAVLVANLHNQNGDPENNAQIDVEVNKRNTATESYSMENKGLGQYRLQLGNLPEGIYEYKAIARKGSTIMDKQQGQFSVGSTSTEFVNTTRNDAMLRYIAQSTGGHFYPFNKTSTIHSDMQQKGLFKPEIKTVDKRFYINRSIGWFLIVIFLLTAEWSIRKYLALP